MEKENNKINPEMDEGTMIREQERLAKAEKNKKRKKLKIITAVFIVVLLVAAVWYVSWGRSMLAANTASTTVKIEKSAGQTVVYARIDEINGNEITYTIAEEVKAEETTGTERANRQSSQSGMQMQGGNIPDMSEMPGGGEMPDMSQVQQGGRGQGGRGQKGDSSGMTQPSDRDSSTKIVYDDTTYLLGTEAVTKYIPVGTDVTTKLGTVTTFSRLAAEDYVALVMEKDGDEEIIVAVYIIG